MIAKHIGAAIRAVGPGLGSITEAILLMAGAGSISYGAGLVYMPAGWIVGGALLITGVILRARGNG